MTKVYDAATDLITFARLQSQNTTSGSSYLGSDGLLKFAAEDEPRIEYAADGSLKGLLIEEQRTNLITYSEEFSQSYWAKDVSGTGSTPVVTASSLTDPAGGTGAYQVEFDAGAGTAGGDLSMLQTSGIGQTVGVDYTHSIWVRGDVGGEQIVVRGVANGAFDLFTLTTDWTRISATETATSTVGYLNFGIRQGVNGTINSSATVHIYGAQIEQGSFATSYIPTSGSTVTRSPDLASIPVSAFGYNQTAGTVVVEYQAQEFTNETAWSLSDGTIQQRIQHTSHPNTYGLFVVDGGNEQALIPQNPTGRHNKVSTAFKNDSFSAAFGGTLGVPDTSGTVPIVNQMYLGSLNNTSERLNGHIKSLKYYPRRLTDVQLQELTS